ncbi:MAG: CYTH domain-containing protein [Verrucomicrobiaceae bacterium]|nr:CYTH domain-containing protein [Verrucomicrobiaceae bacterium]
MPAEIERKFLLASEGWRNAITQSLRITQGYLSRDPERTVRVRISGEQAWMTIKGKTEGISRSEIEFPLPVETAQELIPLCFHPLIDKTRHIVLHDGSRWEIDEFHGANAGLIIAEIELPSEETAFARPAWLGDEVSHDFRYTNASLSERPFSQWG